MKKLLVVAYSIKDPAGKGMAEELRELLGKDFSENVGLVGFEESVVEFDFLEERSPADFYLILSKHRSEAGVPSLTVHHTGNPRNEALLGGNPEELGWSFPRLSGYLLRRIKEEADKEGISNDFEISYEVTHHGPTNISKPLVFFEIGSDYSQWIKKNLHELMARVAYDGIVKLVDMSLPECERSVGFGGGHYSRRHSKLTFEKNICFGHLIPKYVLKQGLSDKVLEQVFAKNYEGVTSVYFEKKSAVKLLREHIREYALSRDIVFHYF